MNRGDVVEVDWQYSDMTGGKVRPAVVVQADYLNGLIDDTILVQITSKKHGIPGTEVELDPSVETTSGLSKSCVASCINIRTFDQALVLRTIGVLSDAAMQQIEASLKMVMEIRLQRYGTHAGTTACQDQLPRHDGAELRPRRRLADPACARSGRPEGRIG
jgi:mRNA-degrading endonuclease toxin of MazEF toxin-antitoxin module